MGLNEHPGFASVIHVIQTSLENEALEIAQIAITAIGTAILRCSLQGPCYHI